MAEEEESKSTFSDACFLIDYIDMIAKRNACKAGPFSGYANFYPVTCSRGSGAMEIIAKLVCINNLNMPKLY